MHGQSQASSSLCYPIKDTYQVLFVENTAPCWVLAMIKYVTLCQQLSSLDCRR